MGLEKPVIAVDYDPCSMGHDLLDDRASVLSLMMECDIFQLVRVRKAGDNKYCLFRNATVV